MPSSPLLFDLDDQVVLNFTVLQRNGTVYDLTGKTISLLVEGVSSFSCAIVSATSGTCSRTVTAGDFPVAARYRAQLKVTGGGVTFYSDIFIIQVSESINTTAVGPLPPTIFPLPGGVLFGVSGGLVGQDVTNFFWDDANDNLRLFGGTVGTSGSKVLALGLKTAAPSTSPANTVQAYVDQVNGAGTAGLFLRDEAGSIMAFGGYNGTSAQLQLQASGGNQVFLAYDSASTRTLLGSNQSFPVAIVPNNTLGLLVDPNRNVGLGGASSFGTNAARVVAVASGTAPTTSPADMFQIYSGDIAGSPGNAGLFLRDEQGVIYAFGGRVFGTTTNDNLGLMTNGGTNLLIDSTGNIIMGGGTVGSSAIKVFAMGSAGTTAPTTAPADVVQIWAADRNGAGTTSPFVRTEDSGLNERLLGVVPQAFDNTERTTTSTSTVDLSTLTVNIPAGDAFVVTGLVRKSAGAAASVSIGIKVNGTQIISNFAVMAAGTNQIEFGSFGWGLDSTSFGVARDTNYTQGPVCIARSGASGGALTGFVSGAYAAQLPTAAITSITITGLTGNASVTLGIKDITVYRVART